MQISRRKKTSFAFLSSFWPEALVLSLSLWLYTFQLGQESLWIDEMLSLGSAEGRLDLNRPLYFILLRGWMCVSQGEAWLRLLSVLFGIVCVGLTYLLARQLVNRKTGLVAALLLTLSPLAINHAQEVRYYMMSTCLGVAGTLCLSLALQPLQGLTSSTLESRALNAQRPKVGALLGWILFRSLGFLTVQPNLLLIVPDLGLIGWQTLTNYRARGALFRTMTGQTARQNSGRGRYKINYRWLLALGLLILPIAVIAHDVVPPLIEFLLHQRWYAGTASRPNVLNLLGLLAALTAWPLQGPEQLLSAGVYQLLFSLYAVVTLLLLGSALVTGRLLPSLFLFGRRDRSRLFCLGLWGLLPIALVFALSQVFPFLWLERYSLVAVPYVLILLAAGWLQLWDHRKRLAAFIAALYLVCAGSALARYYTADYHADWRGLAGQITQQEQFNDTVVIYPGSLLPYVAHYYQGSSSLVAIEQIENPSDVNPTSFANDVQAMALKNKRFWLVCPVQDDWSQSIESVSTQLARQGFSLQSESEFVNHWNWGPTLYLFKQQPVS